MKSITEWMIDEEIAQHGKQAGHIAEGLKLGGLPREEQEKRCRLYRKWRPKTDKKNMLPTAQAYDLAIAGVDPDDVVERQTEFFEWNCPMCGMRLPSTQKRCPNNHDREAFMVYDWGNE